MKDPRPLKLLENLNWMKMIMPIIAVAVSMWVFCPWFSGMVSGSSCCCEECVAGCAGLEGDSCQCWTCNSEGCSKNEGCNCPNCVPNK